MLTSLVGNEVLNLWGFFLLNFEVLSSPIKQNQTEQNPAKKQ